MATVDDELQSALQLHQANRLTDAEIAYRKLLQAYPNHPAILQYLGVVLHQTHRHIEALPLIERAISLHPKPTPHSFFNNLGEVLRAIGRLAEAADAYSRAIAINPSYANAYSNLGSTLFDMNRLADAHDALQRAVALDPSNSLAHANFANVLRRQGKLEEAVAALRRAVQLNPSHSRMHGNLLYTLWFCPWLTPEQILAEHTQWAAIHATPLMKHIAPHTNDRDPARRLRIGYVSPDFRDHVVGRLIEPVLASHDRTQFEVFCYSNVIHPDSLTQHLRAHAHTWRDVAQLDDQQLADQIRAEKIDIIIDLALHMSGGRMLTFARSPAPIQMTYLGYNAPTGLPAVDYRITDSVMEQASLSSLGSEQPLELPEVYWTYSPPRGAPDVSPLPAARSGFVTFGSTNDFSKVNRDVITIWAQVLHAVPRSRLLMLLSGGERGNDYVPAAFATLDITPDRLLLHDRCSHQKFLELHHQIDILLDPFPYNGGVTSLDGLWMGVPLVTLALRLPVSRAGATILTSLGLSKLIAHSPAEYVEIASNLASDTTKLAELRAGMSARMKRSSLMDSIRFTRGLESLYRTAWQNWCAAANTRS